MNKNYVLEENKNDLISNIKFDSLEIKNIYFGYSKLKVLKNINLHINYKDFIFIT